MRHELHQNEVGTRKLQLIEAVPEVFARGSGSRRSVAPPVARGSTWSRRTPDPWSRWTMTPSNESRYGGQGPRCRAAGAHTS